ncbi:MAG: hypothetical protein HKN68_19845 [Saprospiraceae bacterium]|nr:hypothetical protein [Saprospiraceae bacterium]
MKKILLVLLVAGIFTACEQYDEDVLEMTGIYEGNVVGVTGPHTMSVSYDRGDEIVIEAPFDGFVWTQVFADVDDQEDSVKDINIYEQEIGPGVFIWGNGSYFQGTLQLDYTIDFGRELVDFRILASQFP